MPVAISFIESISLEATVGTLFLTGRLNLSAILNGRIEFPGLQV